MNLGENEPAPHIPDELALEDKWILSSFNNVVKEVTSNIDKFELGIAVSKLYDFIWDVLCDWYIEICKIRLSSDDEKLKNNARAVLVYVLSNTLKLLHPFMPFITEEIWQTLPHDGESIMISQWPVYSDELHFPDEESEMEKIMAAVKAVRNRRAEMNVPPSRKAHISVVSSNAKLYADGEKFFVRLASASSLEASGSEAGLSLDGTVSIVTEDAKIFLPLAELVDLAAEKKRLEKELADVEKKLMQINAKLSNEGFLAKAPAAVIEEQRANGIKLTEKAKLLKESIDKLN